MTTDLKTSRLSSSALAYRIDDEEYIHMLPQNSQTNPAGFISSTMDMLQNGPLASPPRSGATKYYYDADALLHKEVCAIVEAIPQAQGKERWTLMDKIAKLGERAYGKLMHFIAEVESPTLSPIFVEFFIDFVAWLKAGKNFQGIPRARSEMLREAKCPRNPSKAKCSARDFKSIQEFFTRYLKDGLRSFPENPDLAGSPVDGRIANQGPIASPAGQNIIVKGESMNFVKLAALITPEEIELFTGGQYIDIYLAPFNYHRYHSPFPGTLELTELHVVGGRERPVMGDNREILERNVRVVAKFEDEKGMPFIMVFVSATAVSRIELFDTVIEPTLSLNSHKIYRTPEDFQALFGRSDIIVERSKDLGAFYLGSTVVLLAPRNTMTFDDAPIGQPIKLGKTIGH